jgi:hypothetical protein
MSAPFSPLFDADRNLIALIDIPSLVRGDQRVNDRRSMVFEALEKGRWRVRAEHAAEASPGVVPNGLAKGVALGTEAPAPAHKDDAA